MIIKRIIWKMRNLIVYFLMLIPMIFMGATFIYVDKSDEFNLDPVVVCAPHKITKLQCNADGWFTIGTRPWWKYFFHTQAPTLQDIFEDDGKIIAIMNYKFLKHKKAYLNSRWRCSFNNEIIVNDLMNTSCPHKHSHVIICPVPKGINHHNEVTLINSFRKLALYDVPFCTLKKPTEPPRLLHACTQNYAVNTTDMIQWGLWHVIQGFDRPTVYLNNGIPEEYLLNLSYSVNRRYINFIDWYWPFSKDFYEQQAQQLSCIYRNRGRYKWVALHDIDELIISPNRTVAQYIRKYDNISNDISAVKFCNQYFFNTKILEIGGFVGKDYPNIIKDFTSSDTRCNIKMGKSIVRPENVEYFSVHSVTQGKPMVIPSSKQIFGAHLKLLINRAVIRENFALTPYFKKLNSMFNDVKKHDTILLVEKQLFKRYLKEYLELHNRKKSLD